MSDDKTKRMTPNNIANLVMADEAWQGSLYVKAEHYDSLLAENERLRKALARYGIHGADCIPHDECKCGLDAALRQEQPR